MVKYWVLRWNQLRRLIFYLIYKELLYGPHHIQVDRGQILEHDHDGKRATGIGETWPVMGLSVIHLDLSPSNNYS